MTLITAASVPLLVLAVYVAPRPAGDFDPKPVSRLALDGPDLSAFTSPSTSPLAVRYVYGPKEDLWGLPNSYKRVS